MTTFLNLIKINMQGLLIGDISKKSKRKVILFAILFLYIGGIMSFFMYTLGNALKNTPSISIIIMYGLLISTFLIFILSISSVNNTLYKSKDNDLLLSMPISKTKIIGAKIISLLLICLLYQCFSLLPCIVVYFIFTPVTFVKIICSLFGFLFFPLIIFSISLFISSFFSYFIAKSKYKNLLTTVGLFLFFGVFMYLYMGIDFEALVSNTEIQSQILSLQNFLPNIKWTLNSITNGNMLDLLWLILLSLAFCFAVVLFIKTKYFQLYNKIKSNNTAKYKINYNTNSQFWCFVKKEFKRFTTSPIYIFNIGFGPLLLVGATIYLCFSKASIIASAGELAPLIFAAIPLAISSIIGTCNTSCVSISLEKGYFSYLKSLPISYMKIINAKITFNVLLCLPFILISSTLMSIFFYSNLLITIFNFLLPITFIYLCAVFGILINMLLPKTDAINDTVIIKQSTSSLLGIMCPMFLPLLLLMSYFFLFANYISFNLFIILCELLFIILIAGLYYVIIKKHKNLFKKIN